MPRKRAFSDVPLQSMFSRFTASKQFFPDLPLQSKDFQIECFKALEQQWKPSKASISDGLSTGEIYLFRSTTLQKNIILSRFKANIFRLGPLKTLDGKETRARHRSPTDFPQNEFIYSNPPPPTDEETSRSPTRTIVLWNRSIKESKPQPEINPAHETWNPLFCSEASLPHLFFQILYKNCSQ